MSTYVACAVEVERLGQGTALWRARCECGWRTLILPTRADARIARREHLENPLMFDRSRDERARRS